MDGQRQARLSAAEAGMLRRGGPIPMIGLLTTIGDWIERRHLELMADVGFDDVRRAHNAVFVNLPAQGIRLTDLAAAAGISKQAMAELVDELVGKAYLDRVPDPTDGRAKLIVAAARGEAAHRATLDVVARIEHELADAVGSDALEQARTTLTRLLLRVVLDESGPSST